MSLLSGLGSIVGDIATAGAGVVGGLTGAAAVIQQAQSVVASGQRSIASPCPGTPPDLAIEVARRLNAFPDQITRLRAFITANPPPDKDFVQLQSVWSTVDGLASGAVWTAWGGGDCKASAREDPLRAELRRIAALPLPISAGSSSTLSTTGTLGTGANGSTLGLVVLAIGAGALAFFLARR